MRFHLFCPATTVVFLCALSLQAECIPPSAAHDHVGEVRCVVGNVTSVERGPDGVTKLAFCSGSTSCAFSAVVFARDLKRVGDVQSLQGKLVEVSGAVREYDGQAEIVVERMRQLGGEASHLPPLPKAYDVENHGHYSSGRFSLPRASHPAAKRKRPVTYPVEIDPGIGT